VVQVVGSQARILYVDAFGRTAIAEAINQAVKDGHLKAPVVISRDHHDVRYIHVLDSRSASETTGAPNTSPCALCSGTDSPYRETSNITDGSSFTADMAVQVCTRAHD
jgi:urocanate hydratase